MLDETFVTQQCQFDMAVLGVETESQDQGSPDQFFKCLHYIN